MMKNFKILDCVYLEIENDSNLRDLHNDFEFSDLLFDTKRKEILLKFMPNLKYESVHIVIIFSDVSYVKLSDDYVSEFSNEIEEVGYKESEDHDMDWIMGERNYVDGVHFIMRFTNDSYLRIGARKMIAQVSDDNNRNGE